MFWSILGISRGKQLIEIEGDIVPDLIWFGGNIETGWYNAQVFQVLQVQWEMEDRATDEMFIGYQQQVQREMEDRATDEMFIGYQQYWPD